MTRLSSLNAGRVLDIGLLFSLAVCLGIVLLGFWLIRFELATPPADDVGFFYEWKLAEPNFWTRATPWLGFMLHQVGIWLTIRHARANYRKYSDRLRPANWWALGINAVFILLHYAQTAFFYDGIAQDIPSWTAQYAVIVMLVFILALENRRRGLFAGRKVKLRKEFYRWIVDNHGYVFSFAVIYTFWFHPMVNTWGHLIGFAHVILVMLQGSLMFTRAHVNRRWTFLLEILVLPHAALVAINQGGGLVYMFLYGFLFIFIATQMQGLNLKRWQQQAFTAAFLLCVLLTYTLLREPFQVNEVIRIPLIEYGLVFVFYGIWWLVARATGKLNAGGVPARGRTG
ncbi:MAG: hypothetical protein OXH77_12495 [Anaerolineaceae bacterium]|nr:hypothetical protein [Anaerolineaceae bacterium]